MPLSDDFEPSETGNWNVADDYSKLKIMKQLYLADEYEIIATFGYSDFLEELQFQVPTDELRYRGFRRLVKALIMVINNSNFAIKKGGKDMKNGLKKNLENLEKIYKLSPTFCSIKSDARNKTNVFVLNTEKFEKFLELVVKIKTDINEPLNRNDLIFTYREPTDYEKVKKGLKDKITKEA